MRIVKAEFGPGGFDPEKPNNNAVRWWDADTRTLSQVVGGAIVTRPFTLEENEVIANREAAAEVVVEQDDWRKQLANGIDNLAEARDQAQDAVDGALTASQRAAGDLPSANALVAQAAALAASGSTPEVRALAEGVRQLAVWRVQVDNMLVDLWTWAAAVDRNAVMTDNALIYLARLAQRQGGLS